MKPSLVIAVLALTCAGAVAAQDAAPIETAEKKICRTEKLTGSRTRVTRVCLTAAQWSRLSEITRKNVDGLIKDGDDTTREARLAPLATGPGGASNGW